MNAGFLVFSEDLLQTQTQEPKLDDVVTLQCNATNASADIIDWTYEGVSISQMPNPSLPFTINGNTLEIPSFTKEYEGFYHCVARSNDGSLTQASQAAFVSAFGM